MPCASRRSSGPCSGARAAAGSPGISRVTSLGGIPVDAIGWGADVIYSGTQKCLSAPPGLSPFAMSPRAREVVAARKEKARNWLLDMGLIMSYWGGEGGRTYHHTAPINALYGLHEALVILEEEGLHNAHARHCRVHEALAAGVEAADPPRAGVQAGGVCSGRGAVSVTATGIVGSGGTSAS